MQIIVLCTQHNSMRCKIPCMLKFLILRTLRNTRKLNMLFKVMQWISVNSYWVYILGSLGSCSSICLNTGLPLKTKLFIVSVCVSIIKLSSWKTHLRETVLWLGERMIIKIYVFYLALWSYLSKVLMQVIYNYYIVYHIILWCNLH